MCNQNKFSQGNLITGIVAQILFLEKYLLIMKRGPSVVVVDINSSLSLPSHLYLKFVRGSMVA